MNKLGITIVTKNYAHVAPIACGDVQAEGVELVLRRVGRLGQFPADQTIQAGEMSFSQYLIGLSRGGTSVVGIPIFITRNFRHRCFFTLRESGLQGLADLKGKRIGTNAWPDTGNTWSRAALREQGVELDKIDWWVGPVDDPTYDCFGDRPKLDLPSNVRVVHSGQTLLQMLLNGDLDALMCPHPPAGFGLLDSPIVRVVGNYRQIELDYLRRVRYFPCHHIVGIQRQVLQTHPWVAKSLFDALDQSMIKSQIDRRSLGDSSPWVLADMDDMEATAGSEWRANGVDPNLRMIQALCDEELAQGLVSSPINATAVFEEFTVFAGAR